MSAKIELADIEPEKITVKLKHPAMFNGIKYSTLTIRAPLVADIMAGFRQSPNNDKEREMILISRLAMVTIKDLEGMHLIDYQRVQEACARFFSSDDAQQEYVINSYEETGPGNALPTRGD